MLGDTRIAEKIEVEEIKNTLGNYGREDILCTPHTFFRLSEKQRKIFTCDTLKDVI